MALSNQVAESLRDAQSDLRNAMAFAARTERPMVISVIANTLQSIDSVMSTDELLDKLEDRLPGSSGNFGTFIDPEQ